MSDRYILVHGIPKAVSGCNTYIDLSRYLEKDPHPRYRLVSCQFVNGNYTLVWEKKDKPYQPPSAL